MATVTTLGPERGPTQPLLLSRNTKSPAQGPSSQSQGQPKSRRRRWRPKAALSVNRRCQRGGTNNLHSGYGETDEKASNDGVGPAENKWCWFHAKRENPNEKSHCVALPHLAVNESDLKPFSQPLLGLWQVAGALALQFESLSIKKRSILLSAFVTTHVIYFHSASQYPPRCGCSSSQRMQQTSSFLRVPTVLCHKRVAIGETRKRW